MFQPFVKLFLDQFERLLNLTLWTIFSRFSRYVQMWSVMRSFHRSSEISKVSGDFYFVASRLYYLYCDIPWRKFLLLIMPLGHLQSFAYRELVFETKNARIRTKIHLSVLVSTTRKLKMRTWIPWFRFFLRLDFFSCENTFISLSEFLSEQRQQKPVHNYQRTIWHCKTNWYSIFLRRPMPIW